MNTGYTYEIPQAQKDRNELNTLQLLASDGNAYWKSLLDNFVSTHPHLSSATIHKIGSMHLSTAILADEADIIRWSEYEQPETSTANKSAMNWLSKHVNFDALYENTRKYSDELKQRIEARERTAFSSERRLP